MHGIWLLKILLLPIRVKPQQPRAQEIIAALIADEIVLTLFFANTFKTAKKMNFALAV